MNYVDFLAWVRGPAFQVAFAIGMFGITLRLLEIFSLGQTHQYAAVRNSGSAGGLRTLFRRFLPAPGVFQRSQFIIVGGYLFHLGFFITFLLFAPHILLLKKFLGISWPGLPAPVISLITVITLVAMVALLIRRLNHPVQRLLSSFEDYLTWAVTFLPLLTGYLAFHHMLFPYQLMLALHLLSVEILMIIFPFTKLMHALTFIFARWSNGARAAQKGVNV